MTTQPELKKIIPSLVWYRPFEPFAYSFIRFCTGAMLATHGVYRLFFSGSVAELGALSHLPSSLVGTFELIAGVLLAFGLLTRIVALLLAIEWFFIAIAVPLKPGTSWFLLGATAHYPAMVTAFCLAFFMSGGGYCSLDRRIGREW